MRRLLSLILMTALLLSLVGVAEELSVEIGFSEDGEAAATPQKEFELDLADDVADGLGEMDLADDLADGLGEMDLADDLADGLAEPEPSEAATFAYENNTETGNASEALNASDVLINATNFPDEIFRMLVTQNCDLNHDGFLSVEEAGKVTGIYLNTKEYEGISSLRGIEYFYALQNLQCQNNQLTSLDVSRCTALTYLYCGFCRLTSLNVSGCTALTKIYCVGNELTDLDVSGCAALTGLLCGENKLTGLDVSRCTALTELDCDTNSFKSLDVSRCAALTKLTCGDNQLTSLDVSKCTALTHLYCGDCRLTNLNVKGCRALESLNCWSNRLTSLDVSDCKALSYLDCDTNRLTSLDVSDCKALSYLECDTNQLTSLDVSGCPKLVTAVKKDDYAHGYLDGYVCYEYDDGDEEYRLDCDFIVVITPKPTWFILNACTVTVGDQVYTGKALKPSVTVKYGRKKLTEGKDYTTSFKNNVAVGKASITLTGKGKCEGSVTASFSIIPKPVKSLKLKTGDKRFTASWKKISSVTGYQLQYSLKKDFSASKKVKVKGAATVKKVVKGLKKGETYYVRIRCYQTLKGTTYWSDWSPMKKIKVK